MEGASETGQSPVDAPSPYRQIAYWEAAAHHWAGIAENLSNEICARCGKPSADPIHQPIFPGDLSPVPVLEQGAMEAVAQRLLEGEDVWFVPPKTEDGGELLLAWLRNNWAIRREAASALSRLSAEVDRLNKVVSTLSDEIDGREQEECGYDDEIRKANDRAEKAEADLDQARKALTMARDALDTVPANPQRYEAYEAVLAVLTALREPQAEEDARMTQNDGGPAFGAMSTSPAGDVYHEPGMSLRDWFAGQALSAIIIGNRADSSSLTIGAAKDAYSVADAMLAAREVDHG